MLNDLGGNRTGNIIIENTGPVSTTLRADSVSPLQHTTRVTLFANSNRVEVSNAITQNFGNLNTWSYSFDINSPDVWHEEVGAVIRGKLLANGGHYSPRNARYDWLTMNHFADISDGAANNFGVTVSNADDFFMKLGASTSSNLDTTTPQINVLAGGQIDGSSLGILNQGGDSYFTQRFALQTHGAFGQTAAMKFALEHQNPLVATFVDGLGRHKPALSGNYLFVCKYFEPERAALVVKAGRGWDQPRHCCQSVESGKHVRQLSFVAAAADRLCRAIDSHRDHDRSRNGVGRPIEREYKSATDTNASIENNSLAQINSKIVVRPLPTSAGMWILSARRPLSSKTWKSPRACAAFTTPNVYFWSGHRQVRSIV